MPPSMSRFLPTLLLCLLPAAASAAGGPAPLGPNAGKFGDWTAATYGDGIDKACYAFTPVTHSTLTDKKRGAAMVTVTERVGAHDEVTITAGYTYPDDAKVSLAVGTTKIAFYTQGDTAFTISGAGAIAAFQGGSAAQVTQTAPHGKVAIDDFSLTGFAAAYSAITAACP